MNTQNRRGKEPLPPVGGLVIMVLLMQWILADLAANPTGQTVIAGGATFSTSGATLTVTQTTDRAVINWNDFSIAAGETTDFVQMAATSAVLNRVTGSNPSQIFGTLNANGNVYLINESGILVGASGSINTNSFIGSTLDVCNTDFMNGGDMVFQGTSTAGIQIDGVINALGGDVVLMSREVRNNGTLSAPNGTVAMAGGTEVLLRETGSDRVYVRVGSAEGMVENNSLVDAARVELDAMGGNIYALAVNNSGVVRANGVQVNDGEVWLVGMGGKVSNSGSIQASNSGAGGRVDISADEIELTTGSSVDASGAGASITVTADLMDIKGAINGSGGEVVLQEQTAGTIIDLGSRVDVQANTLELSNTEIRRISADTLTIGSADAGDIVVTQRISPRNISTLKLVTIGSVYQGTPNSYALDMTNWTEGGSGSGVWDLLSPNKVVQRINGNPTYFVTDDDAGFINSIFEGTITVANRGGPNWDSAWDGDAWFNDDDYIGFVVGYNNPAGIGPTNDLILFDWEQGGKPANGHFTLANVQGNNNINWSHTDNTGAGFDVLQQQGNQGWEDDVTYDFRMTYTNGNFTAEVKGGAFGGAYTEVVNYDTCAVSNPFQAGSFGFMNYSNSHVIYEDFKVTEMPSLDLAGMGLSIEAGNDVTLTSNIDVDTVAINAGGDISFNDTNGYTIGSVAGVNGINAGGTVSLGTQSAVTQNEAINAAGLELTGGSFGLTNVNNTVSSLSGNATDINLVTDTTLTVGTVGTTSGVVSTGNVMIETLGANSDIILNASVSGDTDGSSAATDASVTLNSGNDFHNNAGAGAITSGGGRWLVYSDTPVNNTKGGLAADEQFNSDFISNPPATILSPASNHFVYRSDVPSVVPPVVTVVPPVGTTPPGTTTVVPPVPGDDPEYNNPYYPSVFPGNLPKFVKGNVDNGGVVIMPADESEGVDGFDNTDAKFIPQGYDVRYRAKPNGFDVRYVSSGEKYKFNIVMESSFVEYLDQENQLMDYSLLSSVDTL